MSALDDELAALEAELHAAGSDEPKPAQPAGPRAPKVISAAPVRSAPPPHGGMPTLGGPRLPVSEWQPPETLASAIQSEFPGTEMPELGKQPGSLERSWKPRQDEGSASFHAFTPAGHPVYAPPGMMPSAMAAKPPPPPPVSASAAAGEPVKGAKAAIAKRMVAGVAWEDKTLLEWPEDDFRIFVGDLGNETNDDVLAHAFSRYASFQKAKVIRNKGTGKSMGYGFVSFKDPWDMTKALREMHGKYIGNRPVKVRKSTWKERCMDSEKVPKNFTHALSISDKAMRKGLPIPKPTHGGGVHKDKRFQKKKPKNGLPW
ncbi:hypothetical protein AB1Y20_022560 [Prymnesium parvum]|uniref:RRM domain-containing protein n=1 Tax=Prymnesium parvum TaxID=97485 RepID=A0AB34JJ66_PRYPA